MNPPSRMPCSLIDEGVKSLKDWAERENLKRIIDTDEAAWDRYNDRVHGIHQRLYRVQHRKAYTWVIDFLAYGVK